MLRPSRSGLVTIRYRRCTLLVQPDQNKIISCLVFRQLPFCTLGSIRCRATRQPPPRLLQGRAFRPNVAGQCRGFNHSRRNVPDCCKIARVLGVGRRVPCPVPRVFAAPQLRPQAAVSHARFGPRRGAGMQRFGTFIALYAVAVGGRVRLRRPRGFGPQLCIIMRG